MKSIFLIPVFVWMIVAGGAHHAYAQYFVSPQGNDGNSGLDQQQPLASIDKAVEKAMSHKGNSTDTVTVYLAGGIYRLKEPLLITPRATSQPVVIKGYGNEKAVISGGQKIDGWKKYRNGIWVTRLPEVKNGSWKFSQLFVNGERRHRAKFPNEGFYRVAGFPDNDTALRYNTPSKRFEYAPGEINPKWRNLQDVNVIVYHFWTDSHLPIESVDDKNHIVTFQNRTGKVFTDDFTDNGARYVVENVFEGLDAPGEWYLDKKTGELYYMPKPGEDILTAEVYAPTLTQFLRMEGDPLQRKYVENIHFSGLTFEYTHGDLPPRNSNNGQGAVSVPSAIYMQGVRNCSFALCTIQNIGGNVFNISNGCENNRFSFNRLLHLGAGGFIMNGETEKGHPLLRTGYNQITDNELAHYGETYPSGVGIQLMQTFGNKVLHNAIYDGYYSGISVGRQWGYQRSISWGNIIAFNHIYDIGKGLLSDMGAIYTLGVSPGTVINNNLIHDVDSHTYGGWGIYNDEGSTHILIENNIVYNTKYAGYNIHYTKEITIRNNIFALGRLQQLDRGRQEPHRSIYFENNIVYWKTGVLFEGSWVDQPYQFHFNPNSKNGVREESSTFDVDWNIYFNPTKPLDSVKFHRFSFSEWQEKGKDKHSLYTDPLFVNPEQYDFRLQPGSPAYQLGFKDIDMSTVGPGKPSQKR